jgi:hypothetical protein
MGFEPAVRDDVQRFIQENGYRMHRMVFTQPMGLSPLVADLYANGTSSAASMTITCWWNRSFSSRLRAIRGAALLFWMIFNTQMAPAVLAACLDRAEPFERIYMMLFSHGVNSVGVTPIDDWRGLLRRA